MYYVDADLIDAVLFVRSYVWDHDRDKDGDENENENENCRGCTNRDCVVCALVPHCC